MAKAPNVGIEVSEIMAAAAMLMNPKDLDTYHKNGFKGLVDFLKAAKKLASTDKFVFGAGLKTKAMMAFQGQDGGDITNTNPPYNEWLIASVQGISAAKSIRAWAPNRAKQSKTNIKSVVCESVFLTGNTWPSEIQKFQVSAYGFESYNSSDIVLKFPLSGKGLAYYGISLKKKPAIKSLDPTLINKAFDTVLKGRPDFKKIEKDLQTARTKYFSKVVKEAFKNKLLTIRDNGSLPSDDKKLMSISLKDKSDTKKNRRLIDLKGTGSVDFKDTTLKGKSDLSIFGPITRDPKTSMKAYVNKRIASADSVYVEMIKVMEEYGDFFAKSLINLVLKTNLYKELDEHQFAFALITGAGDIDKEGNPKSKSIEVIPAKGLYTVLCGLSALNDNSKTAYKMIMDKKANEESEGAKVFLKLMKGKINILDLQLRYKGSFMSQPQFQATISNDFKEVLQEQYGKVCKTP